jgi:hypothetical protein
MVSFLGSPLQSTVEVFDRMLVYFGQYDGRYEATFAQVRTNDVSQQLTSRPFVRLWLMLTCAQTEPLGWSLRVLGGLFYYGHVHGEDLYGRTSKLTTSKPPVACAFHDR